MLEVCDKLDCEEEDCRSEGDVDGREEASKSSSTSSSSSSSEAKKKKKRKGKGHKKSKKAKAKKTKKSNKNKRARGNSSKKSKRKKSSSSTSSSSDDDDDVKDSRKRQRSRDRGGSRARSDEDGVKDDDDVGDTLANKMKALREKEAAKERAARERKANADAAKKEAMAKRKVAQAEASAAKYENQHCSKALSKIVSVCRGLEKCMKDDLLEQVPKHVVADAKAALKTLKQIEAVADMHIDGKSISEEEYELVKAVDTNVKTAQEAEKQLSDFLTTCAKHRRE